MLGSSCLQEPDCRSGWVQLGPRLTSWEVSPVTSGLVHGGSRGRPAAGIPEQKLTQHKNARSCKPRGENTSPQVFKQSAGAQND